MSAVEQAEVAAVPASGGAAAELVVEAPVENKPVGEPSAEEKPAEPAGEAPSEDKPGEEAPAKAKRTRTPKAPKEKKPRAPKPPAPSHPPYFEMIKDAIVSLDEKTGSSPYAIAKHMEEKHKAVLPANYKKVLAVQLKNFAAKGKLVKVKASFKLSEAGKQSKKKRKMPLRSTASKTPSSKGNRTGSKKTKKAAAAPKPKQPKTIKSPIAKRARSARKPSVIASA